MTSKVAVFDRLPDNLVQQIVDLIQDLQTLAQLSKTSPRMHHLCHIPDLTQSLFCAPIPISDLRLPPQIHHLINELRIAPAALRHHRDITHADATCLFDQLTHSHQLTTATKLECVRALLPYFQVLADVVPSPDFDRSSGDLILGLAMLRSVPDATIDIPDCVTRAVLTYPLLADQNDYTGTVVARVRRCYWPPFDRVFPHNATVAAHLCARHATSLGQHAVVLALQRSGIRFKLFDFVAHVELDPTRVPLLLPLLYWPMPATSAYKLVAWFISHGHLDHAKALFGCRRFCQLVRSDPIGFVEYLTEIESADMDEFWHYFVSNPLMADLVSRADPTRDHCRVLLHLAIVLNEFQTGTVLMKLPGLDATQGLMHNHQAFI